MYINIEVSNVIYICDMSNEKVDIVNTSNIKNLAKQKHNPHKAPQKISMNKIMQKTLKKKRKKFPSHLHELHCFVKEIQCVVSVCVCYKHQ
uniref:Uncharacterized protein n=1 Tax=Octopus bimaculoides TaxID=37653 RepID=A0A0L8HE89_OCTBM